MAGPSQRSALLALKAPTLALPPSPVHSAAMTKQAIHFTKGLLIAVASTALQSGLIKLVKLL